MDKKKKKFQFVETKSIAWKRRKNIQRAGVVFYFFDEKEIFFILGLDRKFQEWTDFGGSVDVGENGAEAAYREMTEETLGIFQARLEGVKNMIEKSHAVIEPNMVIIFMPLNINKEEFTEYQMKFQEQVNILNNVVENTEINAFTLPEFEGLVLNSQQEVKHKMYDKTALLIAKKMSDIKHWGTLNHTHPSNNASPITPRMFPPTPSVTPFTPPASSSVKIATSTPSTLPNTSSVNTNPNIKHAPITEAINILNEELNTK